jgi:hypothetical protein
MLVVLESISELLKLCLVESKLAEGVGRTVCRKMFD